MTAEPVRLRRQHLRDVPQMVRLFTEPAVRTYLGGPRPRPVAVAMALAGLVPSSRGGRWHRVVADPTTGRMLGTVLVDRRAAGRPGHVGDGGGELELSYLLLPEAWGLGIAQAACRRVLDEVRADGLAPDEPVLVVTQAANQPALRLAGRLGFQEVERFVEFGAEQVLLARPLGEAE